MDPFQAIGNAVRFFMLIMVFMLLVSIFIGYVVFLYTGSVLISVLTVSVIYGIFLLLVTITSKRKIKK